jgi:hypothetical protein
VYLRRRHADKCGYVSADIQKRMDFDSAFLSAEFRPRKQGQTQIDGGRIERVHGALEQQPPRFVRIQSLSRRDETVRYVIENAPISFLIGGSQRVSSDASAKPHVIELGRRGAQTGFNVAQAFAISQLGERHAQKLIQTGEPARAVIATIPIHTAPKIAQRQVRHQLGKDRLSFVHGAGPCREKSAKR